MISNSKFTKGLLMKNNRFSLNLKSKKLSGTAIIIIIIIIICAAVLAGAFKLLISNVNSQILESNIKSMEELALHDQRSIRNSIELRWDTMEGAVRRMSVRDWQSGSELLSALNELTNNIPSVDSIIMLDVNGTEYGSSGLVRENSYLVQYCEGKTERFISRVNTTSYFRENQKETLFEAIPVDFTVCGNRMQWLICEFPIATLEAELKIDSYDGQGYSSVIDSEGNFIINISRSHDFGTYDNFFTNLKNAEFEDYESAEALRDATTTTTGAKSVVYTLNGEEYIMVITTIDYAGWYFITTVPISVFSAQSNAILRIFLLLLAAVAAVVIVILYIMYRRRREQEHLRLLEASDQAKTEFLFNMSHDIRTPMNAILGYTDIGLRHRNDTERMVESLKKTKVAGGHLLNLINDILEMSRIEAGKLVLSYDPLDMRKAINGVVQMNESLATAKSLNFISDMSDIRNPYVYADELHINEVIINLISNAIKYTPEGGWVRYTARQISEVRNGSAVYLFEISDNGIGMSEEFQEHLFEAFSREESSGVSKIEGAGLGLSIVKRIVDLAGGKISVKSKSGEGSTFTVELPFRVMTEKEIADLEKTGESDNQIPDDDKFKGRRVLLVEDNEMNREIATEILGDAGLEVETAEDGELAVEAVAEKGIEYYDFILMDIQMPIMNGYEATKMIRSMYPDSNIKIIALSANAFAEDKAASIAAGMNDHVAKPINVEELNKVMAKYA